MNECDHVSFSNHMLRMVNIRLAHPRVRRVPTRQANGHEPPTTSKHPNAKPTAASNLATPRRVTTRKGPKLRGND